MADAEEGNEADSNKPSLLLRIAANAASVLVLAGIAGGIIYCGNCVVESAQYGCNENDRRKNEAIALEKQIRSDAAKMIKATVLEKKYESVLAKVAEYKAEERRSGLVSQSHAMAFSNETVKIEPRLALKLKTEKGDVMALSVVDGGNIRVESLEMLIEKDSKISFPASNVYATRYDPRNDNYKVEVYKYTEETDFTKGTNVGTKRADRIRIRPSDKDVVSE